MLRSTYLACCICLFTAVNAAAQERDFTLSSPTSLRDSGFLQFLLPRFSLKTRIRPDLQIGVADAEVSLNSETGTPLMYGLGQTFYLVLGIDDTPRQQKAQRFADWLFSEIGMRTIEQFSLDGATVFTAIKPEKTTVIASIFQGDARRGEALSYTNCGRCHVIGERNRMKGIESTPSFGLLRSLDDWEARFRTFYTRIPHPAITQIIGVTEPFDPARPSSIHPLTLSINQLEDILTFMSGIEPADLGAPLIEHQ